MRSIIVANGAYETSTASRAVSATNPCELTLQGRLLVTGLARRAPVELRERRKPLREPADDPERERQPERARSDGGFGRAPDRDPDGERMLQRPRVHAAVLERRAMASRPRDALRLTDGEQ